MITAQHAILGIGDVRKPLRGKVFLQLTRPAASGADQRDRQGPILRSKRAQEVLEGRQAYDCRISGEPCRLSVRPSLKIPKRVN